MTETDRWTLAILKAVIDKTRCELPDNLDWPRLIEMAARHDLLPMIAAGVTRGDEKVSRAVHRRLDGAFRRALLDEARRDYETESLFAEFSSEGIEFVPLKGSALKRLYPSPELRTMNDIDLLVAPERFDRAETILLRLGFSLEAKKTKDYHFLKPPLALELHRRLFVPSGLPRLDRLCDTLLPDRLWPRLLPAAEGSGERHMTPTDFYLHQLLHLLYHFMSRGIGVRYFLDMEIFRRHIRRETLPSLAIDALGEARLTRFAREVDALSRHWFAPESAKPPRYSEALELFVLNSGLHGTLRQAAVLRISSTAARPGMGAKVALLLRMGVPSRLTMKNLYPTLERVPLLLPFYWLRFNLKRIFSFRWFHFFRQFKRVVTTDAEKSRQLAAFCQSLGITLGEMASDDENAE